MSDTFDFSRFGKLFAYECRNYVPYYTKALITFSCIVFSIWVTSAVFDGSLDFEFRQAFLIMLFNVSLFIAPFIPYYNINDRKKGYAYAMMPASTLEKYISMLLVCMIVLPLLTYITLSLSDYFFYLVSSCGIGGFYEAGIFNPFPASSLSDSEVALNMGGTNYLLLFYMIPVAYSMMFNVLFRKAKIIKAILVQMAVGFTAMIVSFSVMLNVDRETMETIGDVIFRFGIDGVVNFWCVLLLAFPLWVTYRRIKNVNY